VVSRTRDQRRVCGAVGRRDGLYLWHGSVLPVRVPFALVSSQNTVQRKWKRKCDRNRDPPQFFAGGMETGAQLAARLSDVIRARLTSDHGSLVLI
jgi:hypothetical protein